MFKDFCIFYAQKSFFCYNFIIGCDDMKSNNFPFYMIGIGFLMIFSGCVSSFIINLKADQAVVLNRMNDVNNTFEEFSTSVSIYEEKRDLLYTEVLSNLFYDTMFNQDKIVKTRITNHEAIVNEINKKKKEMDNLCSEVYYPDSAVNNKCSNYKSIYEQVVNYFVTDIKYYNKHVDEYNTYIKGLNGTSFIEKYKTNKKYIDCNEDGKFDGKED